MDEPRQTLVYGIRKGRKAGVLLVMPGWDDRFFVSIRPPKGGRERSKVQSAFMRLQIGEDGEQAEVSTKPWDVFVAKLAVQLVDFCLPMLDESDQVTGEWRFDPRNQKRNIEAFDEVCDDETSDVFIALNVAMDDLAGREVSAGAREAYDRLGNEHGPLLRPLLNAAM